MPEDGLACLPGESFDLTTTVSGTGTVLRAPDQASYGCGESVSLTAQPGAGAEFMGWGGALSGTTNPVGLTIEADTTVTADFSVDVTPPVITNVTVTAGETSATLTWDTDEAATSTVDYGESTAYELGPVQSTVPVTAHGVTLVGLTPATTYHYQVTVADAAGNLGSTTDATFTTSSSGGGIVGGGGIISDDFQATTFDTGLWTLVDPVGDGTVALEGSGTADARVLLSVPAGTSHDVWTGGNNSVRIMQPSLDEDLEIEVKFESEPTQRYQIQGLLVEQDGQNFLRVDFYSDGSQLRVFAARFEGGVPSVLVNQAIAGGATLYLRLTRLGDEWTPAVFIRWFELDVSG